MLRELTAEQFAEWEMYLALEPWGADTAFLASIVANFSAKFSKKDWKLQDFLPGNKPKALGGRLVDAFKALGAKEG